MEDKSASGGTPSYEIYRDLLEDVVAGDAIIEGKYKILEKISQGKYGVVYKGICLEDGKEIALKFERFTESFSVSETETMATELVFESCIYAILNIKKVDRVAKMRWFGMFEGYKVLVMDLLGPSLFSLIVDFPERFTVRNVMLLGVEMINCLEELHKSGFIHRDIKPDNFCMGLGSKAEKLHLIDFGFAMRYTEGYQEFYGDIPIPKFCGNKLFGSVNALRRLQSRRDDLEAVAYVLVFLLTGTLPWDEAKNVQKAKASTSLEDICKNTPEELLTYLKYVKGLSFKEEPDYDWIRSLFAKALVRCNPGLRLDFLVHLDVQFEPVSKKRAVAEKATK